jgi:hypothetical protein
MWIRVNVNESSLIPLEILSEEYRKVGGILMQFLGISGDILREVQRRSIADFATWYVKLILQPSLIPLSDAPVKHRTYAKRAAVSRLRPVQGSLDYSQTIIRRPKGSHLSH